MGATVRSVANGVIGVAFVWALFCGIGFFDRRARRPEYFRLLAMVFGIVQVPVVLVTIPAIIYGFAVKATTVAIIFTIWLIISGSSDAVLKPLMIGRGLEVPMPVVYLLGKSSAGSSPAGLVGLFHRRVSWRSG